MHTAQSNDYIEIFNETIFKLDDFFSSVLYLSFIINSPITKFFYGFGEFSFSFVKSRAEIN